MKLSADDLKKARTLSARQVATVRAQFNKRKQLIEKNFALVIEKATGVDKYIAADLDKLERRFKEGAAQIEQKYGSRIEEIQSIPVIINEYKRLGYATSGSAPTVTTQFVLNANA